MTFPDLPDGVGSGAVRVADIVPDTPCVEAALAFHRAGFRVIPGHPTEKRSALKWDPWLDKLSPEAIAAHYAEHPAHTLCCILDERLLVLDADTSLAVSALDILEQQWGIESNLFVNTRRGQHRYYRLRAGVIARTSAHSTEEHPERIDVKAARSLVVLPPSPNKTIARCDIGTVEDLVEVGQDFVDAVFAHNGSDLPREHLNSQPVSDGAERPIASAALPELTAMLNQLDPDCSYDEWVRTLMAVHHETGGSAEGFALANAWSARGAAYCGEHELRAKWRSFDGYAGTPITVGTIKALLAKQGDDWVEVVAAAEPQFEPCVGVTIDVRVVPDAQAAAQPSNVFERYSLRGHLAEVEGGIRDQIPIIGQLALSGQATAFFGPPNSAKTLVTMAEAIEGIRAERIQPNSLFYANLDDNGNGLVQKLKLAERYGFHTVAEGYRGFEADDISDLLMQVVEKDQATGMIVIVDTAKKAFNVMDKSEGTAFLKVVRRVVMKGGTVILLAHTNKRLGPDGRPIPGGTSDLVDDVDCAYTLRVISESGAPKKAVEFENIKRRGDVVQRAVFTYSAADGLTYEQLLDSVRQVDDAEAVVLEAAAELRSDADLIAVVRACIGEGIVMRMPLLAAIALRTKCGRRKAQEVVDRYTGDDPLRHHWTFDVQARGAKVYRLLGPAPVAATSETPAADSTQEGSHE